NPRLDAVMSPADALDRIPPQFWPFVSGVLVSGSCRQPTVYQASCQGLAVVSKFNCPIGMDRRPAGFLVIFPSELPIVVQGFAVPRLPVVARFGTGRYPLFGSHMNKVHPYASMFG